MTATNIISNEPTMTRLPGIQPSLPFDCWRIVPYDRTLLYNFKDTISNEEEAITLIRDNFDSGDIIAARQLPIPTVTAVPTTTATPSLTTTPPLTAGGDTNDHDTTSTATTTTIPLIIEVLFASSELRIKALQHEIKYNDTTYLPLTTTTDPAKYTIISLSQMALIPENERLGCFRHWVNTILMDAKATSISERDILHIWLEKDATGIYRGSGTVVLKGYDASVAGLKGNTTRTYMNAPNYPNPKCHIQLSYMCCNRCKILDHHNTVDCTYHPPPVEQQEVQEQSCTSSSNLTPVSKNKTSNSTIVNSPISVNEQPITTVPKVVPATIDLDPTVSNEDTRQKKKKRGGNKEDQQQKDDDDNEEEEIVTPSRRPEKRIRWTISKRTRQ